MTYNSESKQNIKRSTASDIKTYLCDHPAWTVLYFKTETSQKDINKKQYNSHSRNGYVLWTAGCMCPEPSVQTWLTHSLTLKQTLHTNHHTQSKILLYQLWHSRVHFGRKKQLRQLFGKPFHILFTSHLSEKTCLNSLVFFPAMELGSITAQITTVPAQHCPTSISTNTILSSACTLALPVGWWKPCSSS